MAIFGKLKAARRSADPVPQLSEDLSRLSFGLEEISRYGVSGEIVCLAHDAVQSLCAVACADGSVYVCGQPGVQVWFSIGLNRRPAHVVLQGANLVVIDTANTLHVFKTDIRSTAEASTQKLRGTVTCIEHDPALDWLLIAYADGTVDMWDLDRDAFAPYRINNLYRERQSEWRYMGHPYAPPPTRHSPIVGLALHPLDFGTLLVAYPDGAALFSIKSNAVREFYELDIPPGAPGGMSRPELQHVAWSPTGTHFVSVHAGAILAFWDVKNCASPVQARTLDLVDVNRPGIADPGVGRDPIVQIAWCFRHERTEGTVIVAGGCVSSTQKKGVTCIGLGREPTSASQSSAAAFREHADYFARPAGGTSLIPSPPHKDVVSFVLLSGTASPYLHGGDHAAALVALQSNGQLAAYSLRDNLPLANMMLCLPLPALLSAPVPDSDGMLCVHRLPWQALVSRKNNRRLIPSSSSHDTQMLALRGGAPVERHLRAFDLREILWTSQQLLVTLMDATKTELDPSTAITLDVASAIGAASSATHTKVSRVVMAYETGEVATVLDNGMVIVWIDRGQDHHTATGMTVSDIMEPPRSDHPDDLVRVYDAPARGLVRVLDPLCLVHPAHGRVTAVCFSSVGFIGLAYESGSCAILDLRGPRLIMTASSLEVMEAGDSKKERSQRGDGLSTSGVEVATAVNIVVDDGEHGPALFCVFGTSTGRLLVFRLRSDSVGYWSAQFVHSTRVAASAGGAVVSLCAIAEDGTEAAATGRDLTRPQKTMALLVVTGRQGYATLTSVFAKKARETASTSHKHVNVVANVCMRGDKAVLVAVTRRLGAADADHGSVSILSLPQLSALGRVNIPPGLGMPLGDAMQQCCILTPGDVYIPTLPMRAWGESRLVSVFPRGMRNEAHAEPLDLLYDVHKQAPARPTISTWQWVTGEQYINATDFDTLVAGPARPKSKRQLAEEQAQRRQQQLSERAARDEALQKQRDERQRQQRQAERNPRDNLNERGTRLADVQDTFGHMEEASNDWLNEIKEFTKSTKKDAMMGVVKSFF